MVKIINMNKDFKILILNHINKNRDKNQNGKKK